jgi:hypothetical protein
MLNHPIVDKFHKSQCWDVLLEACKIGFVVTISESEIVLTHPDLHGSIVGSLNNMVPVIEKILPIIKAMRGQNVDYNS